MVGRTPWPCLIPPNVESGGNGRSAVPWFYLLSWTTVQHDVPQAGSRLLARPVAAVTLASAAPRSISAASTSALTNARMHILTCKRRRTGTNQGGVLIRHERAIASTLTVPFGGPAIPVSRDPKLCAPQLNLSQIAFSGNSLSVTRTLFLLQTEAYNPFHPRANVRTFFPLAPRAIAHRPQGPDHEAPAGAILRAGVLSHSYYCGLRSCGPHGRLGGYYCGGRPRDRRMAQSGSWPAARRACERPSDYRPRAFHKGGVDLLSHKCSTIGRCGLTSVFGMGTGVARNVWTPPLAHPAFRPSGPAHWSIG